MADIIFEVIKIVVMLTALLVARYVVPWMNEMVQDAKTRQILEWTKQGVLAVQQMYYAETGETRKEMVKVFLGDFLKEKNVTLTDEQVSMLIEAAVKQMKMELDKTGK